MEVGKNISSFAGHEDAITACCFHPDKKLFVTGSVDRKIKVFDLKTRKCEQTITQHGDTIWSLRFSPDGNYLISGSEDGQLAVHEFK